nr:MAG TPA: hypothetical protein [Caudoviricetes sp.]
MQLKFDGQNHAIDSDTLVSVLISYQQVIQEINRIYGGGSQEIRLQVNALKKGSFVIDIEIVRGLLQQLFSKDSMEYIAALATISGAVYKIYKMMKGRPIKNEEDRKRVEKIIFNDESRRLHIDINNCINIYNSQQTREPISKSIQTADEDPNVTGFTINDAKSEEIVSFTRDEFKDYCYNDFDEEEEIPDERIIESDETLVIITLCFEKGARWQFMYNGFKIPIIVKDDALMQKINEGERFGKGDSIKVKLRTIQKYNKEYRTYENKSYKIIAFYEHIVPPKEGKIF